MQTSNWEGDRGWNDFKCLSWGSWNENLTVLKAGEFSSVVDLMTNLKSKVQARSKEIQAKEV